MGSNCHLFEECLSFNHTNNSMFDFKPFTTVASPGAASDAAAVSAEAASDLDLAVCGEDQSVRIFAVPAAFLELGLAIATALASARS